MGLKTVHLGRTANPLGWRVCRMNRAFAAAQRGVSGRAGYGRFAHLVLPPVLPPEFRSERACGGPMSSSSSRCSSQTPAGSVHALDPPADRGGEQLLVAVPEP